MLQNNEYNFYKVANEEKNRSKGYIEIRWAPRLDEIHKFWFKIYSSIHETDGSKYFWVDDEDKNDFHQRDT